MRPYQADHLILLLARNRGKIHLNLLCRKCGLPNFVNRRGKPNYWVYSVTPFYIENYRLTDWAHTFHVKASFAYHNSCNNLSKTYYQKKHNISIKYWRFLRPWPKQ
jgi:hypothetical protein